MLIVSTTPDEHKEHLRITLSCYGIIINPTKCVLGVSSLHFLGHLVDSQGIRPLEEKVKVIQEFPQPAMKHDLRKFLGLINFYHRFIPNCAQLLQPLNNLLSTCSDKTIQWTQPAIKALDNTKQALATATLLFRAKLDAPTCIMTDALDVAVGAVLQQFIIDQWCPIAFFSTKLKPAETRYSAFERELLAIYLAIKHFRHFVEGRQFHVITDHKPLTFALTSKPSKHTPRQVRHLDYISQFTTDIRHIRGKDNHVADTLSPLGAIHCDNSPPISFQDIAEAQRDDPELTNLPSFTSLKLQSTPLPTSKDTIICDVYHDLSFQRNSVAQFLICYTLSPTRVSVLHRNSLLIVMYGPISMPMYASGHALVFHASDLKFKDTLRHHQPPLQLQNQVHIDIVGPLPLSHGFSYILTCKTTTVHYRVYGATDGH